MNRHYLWRFLKIVVIATAAVGVVGLVVMSLWLVGGLRHGGHGRGHWRRRMAERWEAMSDEERARFGHRFGRCGGARADKAGGLPA